MSTLLGQQPGNARQQLAAGMAAPKRAWSLRAHLLVFGVALILPLLTLAGFLLFKINNSSRAEIEQRMVQVAAGLAAEIDREIQRRLTILQTLGISPALARGDYATFHAYASAVLDKDKAGIFLIDPKSLQQLLNTYVAFGTDLPTYGSPETARRVVETGHWQISDLFIGRISRRPALDLALPIIRDEKIQYILVMGLEPFMFDEIVRARKFPADWIINIADRAGTIIVRSKEQDKYLGTRLPADLIAQQAGSVTRIASLEGIQVLRATATSRLSGWQVAINLPAAAAEWPLREGLAYLAAWSALALLLTAFIATWFARRMARPIAVAADAAADLAHRREVPSLESRISEANRLIGAIKRAAQDLSDADEIRRAAEEQRRSAYQSLEAEKTQTAALLRQREAILSATPNGVLVIDHDGRIHLFNERLASQFGYRHDELIGQGVEMLVPDRFRGHHAALRQTFTAAPSLRPMGAGRDLFGLRKDGSEFPIEIGLSPFTVDGREMVLATVIDITERKRAEQALIERERQQAALYQLVDHLHRAETFSSVYDAALDGIQHALHCERASILLRDDAGVMRFVGWRGLSDAYRKEVEGHSPWASDEVNPQPVCIEDIDSANLPDSLKDAVRAEKIRALAFIPIVADGKLIGKFMTYHEHPHTFSGDEIDFALALARELGGSIVRKRADEALRESERRLELALTAGRMGAWEWNIRTNAVFWSSGLERIHGLKSGTFGGTFDDFKRDIHPADIAGVLGDIQDAVKERRDHHIVYRMKRANDGATRWLEAFGRLTLGLDGLPESMAGVCIDITERKRAEETEKLLTAELQHRTKNLFAVVQALAIRTLRGPAALDEAREVFVGRLQALARSDARLANFAWSGASLSDVVKSELEPFARRTRVDGPEIILSPQAAQNFALAIHELATNAAKYGSLSTPGGTAVISWTVANNGEDETLHFHWQEQGGPSVAAPKRKGFGTSLLEATLGKGHLEFAAEGLSYDVRVDLAEISPPGEGVRDR